MSQPEPSARSVGDLIRERRLTSRMSLRELASLSKVSNAYLSQVERGLHQPSIRVLRAVADALEMSSEQMMAFAGLGSPTVDPDARSDQRPTPTEISISADVRLSAADRRTLLDLYRRLAGLSD